MRFLKKIWDWFWHVFWKSFWIDIKVPFPLLIFILACIIGLCVIGIISNPSTIDDRKFKLVAQGFMERGYFEGQKDAVKGDVRVAEKCSTWVWTKSPWDSAQSGSRFCIDSVQYHPETNSMTLDGKLFKF